VLSAPARAFNSRRANALGALTRLAVGCPPTAITVIIAKLVDRDPSTLDGLHVLIRSETIESVVEETFISDTAFGTGVE
jgi:hypothetical protein